MAYDPKAIANQVLEIAQNSGERLTPMKLQKLVYYAHGWHLALTGDDLIDEQVEAWSYGPVIRSLYREFREFGDQPITRLANKYEPKRGGGYLIVEPVVGHESRSDKFTRSLLGRVWELYGRYSGIQLSNMTHEPGTPWKGVMDGYDGKPPRGTDIPRAAIRDYFRSRLRPAASSS